MKSLFFLLTATILIQANEIETKTVVSPFDNIKTLEKGIKRDFYINEYFKTDINPKEALNALSLVDNFNNKMFFNFAKKFNHDETIAVAQCMNMNTKDLIDSYADCIVAGMSLTDASSLSSIELDLLMQKTVDKYPAFTKQVKVLSSSIPFTKLIVLKKDAYYDIFLNVEEDFRVKYFNYKLPKRTFAKIFKDKNKFNEFIQVSLTNPRLDKLNKNLIVIDDSALNSNSSFLLALNALRFNDFNKAYEYLNNASNKTESRLTQDKILFWKYLITKDESILLNLANSLNINMYSLYANELLSNVSEDYNFLTRLEEFDNQLNSYDINRVALLYAIAKIKSNFDSNKVSKKFDLGVMQLNDKFVTSISNNFEINTTYSLDQFSIENNIKYANMHLNNLENMNINILFKVLAYEGNGVFLNKKLKNKIFSKKKDFEPFMSLELLTNNNKEYLKDILSYKYLYHNYLSNKNDEKITLSSIFETLIESDHK